MSHSAALWLSLLLLLGNAFFVGAEFAVMAARRSQLEPMAAAGSKRAQVSLEALEQVALAARVRAARHHAVLGGPRRRRRGGAARDAHPGAARRSVCPRRWPHPIALALALLVVAYLHVVIGEMVPKNLAIAGPDKAALALAPPLLYITRALRPVIRLMEGIAKGLVRALGIEPKDELASAFTAQEVQHIVAESHREGLLEGDQHGLVTGALEFSDRVAGDVAVPLDQLVTLHVGATPADVEHLVAKRGFSRFPFVDAGGEVTGYLHLKDILYADEAQHEQPVPLKRVRRLATVSAGDEVEDVLETMQRTGSHLARVVDAEGTVVGVVFLEDVLEELVGEVTDASQRPQLPQRR